MRGRNQQLRDGYREERCGGDRHHPSENVAWSARNLYSSGFPGILSELTLRPSSRYVSKRSPVSGRPRRRGSQVVRQRSAKPLFIGSTPIRASNETNDIPL